MQALDFPSNPFAILTFISAPAVLTNASCVLLFGTGNRYGRAIDRMHELYEAVESGSKLDEVELKLKIFKIGSITPCKKVKLAIFGSQVKDYLMNQFNKL